MNIFRVYIAAFAAKNLLPFLSQNDSASILSEGKFPEFYFCSHSSYNSPINLIPSPDYYICIGLLVDNHIVPILSHNGIRSYGLMFKNGPDMGIY